MNIFISGGAKNGKSMYAQHLAKQMAEGDRELYYIATMDPVDEEDEIRIQRHIEDREGWGFETIEQPTDMGKIYEKDIDLDSAFLFDSVTAILSNEMFKRDGSVDLEAYKKVAKDLVEFAHNTGNTVFVSDYIYSDAARFDELTEKYRESLAYIDRQLCEACDTVIEVAYGIMSVHKGSL